jgi:hypothetical protein
MTRLFAAILAVLLLALPAAAQTPKPAPRCRPPMTVPGNG